MQPSWKLYLNYYHLKPNNNIKTNFSTTKNLKLYLDCSHWKVKFIMSECLPGLSFWPLLVSSGWSVSAFLSWDRPIGAGSLMTSVLDPTSDWLCSASAFSDWLCFGCRFFFSLQDKIHLHQHQLCQISEKETTEGDQSSHRAGTLLLGDVTVNLCRV